MGNIIGDKFRKFVNDQINKRQEIQGNGLSTGDFKTEEEIVSLNHYTNFQPLWAADNIAKGSKY